MGLSKSQSSTRIKDPDTGFEASIRQDSSGQNSMHVIAEIQNNGAGELIFGVDYDKITVTEVSAKVENYLYYLATTLVRTVEVTYRSGSKDEMTSVEII